MLAKLKAASFLIRFLSVGGSIVAMVGLLLTITHFSFYAPRFDVLQLQLDNYETSMAQCDSNLEHAQDIITQQNEGILQLSKDSITKRENLLKEYEKSLTGRSTFNAELIERINAMPVPVDCKSALELFLESREVLEW